MTRSNKINKLWSFGLSEELECKMQKLLGKNYQLVNWIGHDIPNIAAYEADLPDAALLSPVALKYLMEQPERAVRHLALLPKVMVLDAGYTQAELEFSIDAGIVEIIRPPYTQAQVFAKIRRTRELESVHDDVLRMSKEIVLEREILERKNDILNFLVNFLTATSVSMHPKEILQTVYGKLQMIFPVRSMQAALWNDACDYANVYLSVPEKSKSYEEWLEVLRDAIMETFPQCRPAMDTDRLVIDGQDQKWIAAAPSDGYIIKLPIAMDGKQFGILLVLTNMALSFSRDQAFALNSALRHLALTLKNAKNYQIMKQHADFDGLTGIFNRRHLDLRIEEEIDRCKRYAQPLSLIFADLDHFKQINDTKGHHAGDSVLQQVATIITQSLRASDYASRYGGEEFVILLPHTGLRQAQKMAERLRKNIARHTFHTDVGNISLTISMGVADLESLPSKDAHSLMHEADTALYQAKRAGRNRTMTCGAAAGKVAV